MADNLADLTDLIAAEIARHRLRYGSEDAYNGERWLCTTCPWLMKANTGSRPNATVIQAHANHVAERLKLVVEQHTNGRITELEAAVVRVEKALEAAEKSVPDDWGVTYIYTSQLRAALEGEQQ